MPLRTAPLPRMAGHLTFMRVGQAAIDALTTGRIGLVGIPREDTDTRATGARFGPNAIRETSVYFGWHANPQYSRPVAVGDRSTIDTSSIQARLFDLGDIPVGGLTAEAGDNLIRATLRQIASSGASALVLGGDKGIAAPALEGVAAETPAARVQIGGFAGAPGPGGPVLCFAPRRIASAEASPDRGASGQRTVSARQLAGLDATAISRMAQRAADDRPLAVHLDISALNSCWHGASDMPRFDGLTLSGLRRLLTGLGRLPVAILVVTGLNPTLSGLGTVKTGQRLLVTALLDYICARLGAPEDRNGGRPAA